MYRFFYPIPFKRKKILNHYYILLLHFIITFYYYILLLLDYILLDYIFIIERRERERAYTSTRPTPKKKSIHMRGLYKKLFFLGVGCVDV